MHYPIPDEALRQYIDSDAVLRHLRAAQGKLDEVRGTMLWKRSALASGTIWFAKARRTGKPAWACALPRPRKCLPTSIPARMPPEIAWKHCDNPCGKWSA